MNKILYYLIQWTWGLPMSLIGLIVFCICKLCGCRHYMYRKSVCIVVPFSFDGISLGMFFVRDKWGENICEHEYGHSIQNLYWGWIFIIVIGIPSLIRSMYRKIYLKYIYPRTRKKLPNYYSIWFEKQASTLGAQANNNIWSFL